MERTLRQTHRIEEAFFKKEKSERTLKTPLKKKKVFFSILLSSLLVSGVIITAIITLGKFDFLILVTPKQKIGSSLSENILTKNISVATQNRKSYANLFDKGTLNIVSSKSRPAVVTLDFPEPLNAKGRTLTLQTQQLPVNTSFAIFFRDSFHYSNALAPVFVTVNKENPLPAPLLSIPLPEESNPQIDWTKINQIRIKVIPLSQVDTLVVIKHMSLEKKEAKL